MKKKVLSLMLALVLVFTVTPTIAQASAASRFTDVPTTHWAAEYINYATDQGLVNGYGNGLFGPDDALTEAQVAQIVYRANGGRATSTPWYQAAVDWTNSRTGTRISPDTPASRQFVVELIYALEKSRAKVTEPTIQNIVVFGDTRYLPLETLRAIWFCRENDLVAGYPDGTFRPADTLTRAQGAKILGEAYKLFWDNGTSGGIIPGNTADVQAFNKARAMAQYAERYGLATELATWSSDLAKKLFIQDFPETHQHQRPASAGWYWSGLYIQTPDGTYGFITDGTTWFCQAREGWVEMAEEYLRDWFFELAAKYTTAKKTAGTIEYIEGFLNGLGLTYRVTAKNGEYAIEVAATNSRGKYQPYWLYYYTSDYAWLISEQEDLGPQVKMAQFQDLYAVESWIAGYATTLTYRDRVNLAVTALDNATSWTVKSSVHANSGSVYWLSVTATRSRTSHEYIVGGEGTNIVWYLVKNGKYVATDFESVVATLS